ncbi:hypothetical protein ACHAWF_014274 [Thalassiosira exigua]
MLRRGRTVHPSIGTCVRKQRGRSGIPSLNVFLARPEKSRRTTGALFSLKRKKLYESELDKIANIKMTLETQVMNLESAAQNAATFGAMSEGKNAMTNLRTQTNIDNVDNLMDDIKEEMEMADEISNALAQPVDPLMADEDDLLAELQQLEAEDVEEQLLQPTKAGNVGLPSVPNKKLPSIPGATKAEEEELKQLEAELAGL